MTMLEKGMALNKFSHKTGLNSPKILIQKLGGHPMTTSRTNRACQNFVIKIQYILSCQKVLCSKITKACFLRYILISFSFSDRLYLYSNPRTTHQDQSPRVSTALFFLQIYNFAYANIQQIILKVHSQRSDMFLITESPSRTRKYA